MCITEKEENFFRTLTDSDVDKEKHLYAEKGGELKEKKAEAKASAEVFSTATKAIEKDMEDQVTGAVKSVASKKGLSLVVDKSAVIYGGTDITKDVSDTLNKSISASQSAAASQSK